MSSDSLIPPIGTIPVQERMFRINWVASLERSPSGVPLHTPEFVAQQGRSVRIVDVREPDELTGPLGYIPGSHWVPRDRARTIAERLPRDAPVVIVSRGGERGSEIAHALERSGMRMVASLRGGMVAWKSMGFGSTRDPSILEQRDVLRPDPEPVRAEPPLSRDAIEVHLGDPQSVRWIKLAAVLLHGKRSCVDGRDDSAVIGTPGGDGGEIVLALAALEAQVGRAIEPDAIAALILRAVDALGSLYCHTDVSASNELILSMRKDARLTEAIGTTYEALEWRKWLRSPPADVREIVLEHMLVPGRIGCGHLRLMMQHPESYRVRPGLAADFVRAYLRTRWADTPQLDLVPLAGGHREGAVINVRVESALHSYSPVPLISPAYGGMQMFVNHPQVSSYLRRETAALLCEQGDLFDVKPSDAGELAARMEELAAHQLGVTLGHLAPGLPIYDVLFQKTGRVAIERVARDGLPVG
jgi:rhodanese-related sulfurtransferase